MRFIIGILLFPARALMRVVRAYFRAANALNSFDLDLWLWHKIRWLKLDVLGRWLYLLVVFILRTSFRLAVFLIRLSWRLLVLLLRMLLRLAVFLAAILWRLTVHLMRLLLRLAGKLCGLLYPGIPRLAALVVCLAPSVFWGTADVVAYAAVLTMEAARGFAAGVYRVFQRGVGGVTAGALVVSGLYMVLSPTWTELYRFNIIFHLAVGVLALAIVPRDYFVWLRKNFSALAFLRLFFVPAALTAAVIFLPRAHETPLRSSLILAAFGLLLFANSIGFSGRRTGGGGGLETLLIQALMCLWFFEAATGVVIALNYESGAGWIFKYHRVAAYAFVGLIAARRLAVRRVCRCPGCVRGRYARAAAAAVLAVVFAADAFVALPQQLNRVYLSTVMLEKRPPEQKYFSSPPDFRPESLDVTRSCGEGAGCHAEIVTDHLRSLHARSYHLEYFQKNFELMASEVGERNTVTCNACHIPSTVFNPALDHTDFADRTNQSCVFCHSVSGVRVDREKPTESFYAIAVHDRHLSFFLDGGTGREVGRVGGRERRLILLGRTGHAKVFSRRLYESDEFCVSCHHHQIVSMNRTESPYRYPKCVACHMQPRRMLGLKGNGNLKNHIFPGANLHFAAFLSDTETEKLNRRYAAGEIRTAVPAGWEHVWDVRKYRSDEPGRSAWFSMQIELLSGVTPGGETRIRIFTTNNGICHDFPASALDLYEAWLEVTAEDAAGNVFFHSGEIGADLRVDPAAHRLGGVMMGMDGVPVEKNRVWQIKEKIVHRVIGFGEVVADDYAFAAPEGIEGPVSISASWRYRKLNQDFLDWAYPGEPKTAPVATVASARLEAPVKSSKVRKKTGGVQNEPYF